jgi:hypothetical protein
LVEWRRGWSMTPSAAEARASDLAAALGLHQVSRGVWRGACPLCGGSRRFQVKEGDRAALFWCFSGCKPADILRELRQRGLMPNREQPFDREAWQRERERRREAQGFARVGEIMLEHALETLPAHDPARRDLTELQARLRLDPDAEMAWWKQHKPELAAALVEAWRKHERRLRRRAAQWVDSLREVDRG